jgi:sodium/proline symporter/sodium/pantothenate symporter
MMGVGLVTRYLVVMGQAAPLKNPDDAISFFLMNYTPPIVAGIVMAGIAAAIMSTCDSFINIAAAAAVRDIPFAFGKKFDDQKQLAYGRYAILIISVVTILVALNLNTLGVALLGVFGWSTFAAALGPALAVGLNWKRATRQAAVASIAVGLFLNVLLEMLKVLKIYSLPHGIYNGAFTMVVSLIVFIIVSYLTAPTKMSKAMEQIMDA